MNNRLWILGSSDPEMELIEQLLHNSGETVVYAVDSNGERVRGGTAYRGARAEIPADVRRVYLVECDVATPESVERVVIDHHRPGDPGYGRYPEGFFEASSIGQVIRRLGQVAEYPDSWERVAVSRHPHWCGAIERQGDRVVVRTVTRDGDPGEGDDEATACVIPRELVLAAAADHCLAAAYRGQCPGVDPDELMKWRAESRARFQKRSAADVLADIERARQALREAPDLVLNSHRTARDMRGRHVPELPEAASREGVCFVADGLPDGDGRIKVVCQGGSPAQIEAFMQCWAPSQGLTDVYGDPARGIAGAYKVN